MGDIGAHACRGAGGAVLNQLTLCLESRDEPAARALGAWRCTIHMIQWRRLDRTSYLYGVPVAEWYGAVIRGNLDRVGGLMGVW